jgi:hypothetical protein
VLKIHELTYLLYEISKVMSRIRTMCALLIFLSYFKMFVSYQISFVGTVPPYSLYSKFCECLI